MRQCSMICAPRVIGLSQSATMHTLNRMGALHNDQLLRRSGTARVSLGEPNDFALAIDSIAGPRGASFSHVWGACAQSSGFLLEIVM